MEERNPRGVYDENGRLMAVNPSNEPPKEEREGYKLINVLSICFIVLGGICIMAGFSLATKHYDFDWLSFCGGLLASMFCFGWAAVMRVCALYMREHDK